MPAPAGTGLSRRSFLLRTGGLALSVYGASLLSPRAFVDGIAEAASSQGKVLVSVFLEGGIDALSVLSPVNDDTYRQLAADPAPRSGRRARPGPRTRGCSGIRRRSRCISCTARAR